MRKMILTLTLAIASSVWMTNEASNWCMPSVRTLTEPWIEVNGTFQAEGIPCEPDEVCPPCLTIVLVTANKTFYLVTDDGQLIEQLDTIKLGTTATVSGIPFTHGSYNYIEVHNIEIGHTPLRLNSLCDEWNVLEHNMSLGPEYESFNTLHFRLTSDTIINETLYVRLEQDGIYKGALREGTNADIYYVPNLSTHEYLLYAFNAQMGDSLENLWFGANENENYFVSSATVVNIEPTTPRKFTIDFEWQSIYSYAAINDTSEIMHAELVWLEGLGFQYGGPLNYKCPFDCAGAPGRLILCAYKNGEHIYTSEWGEQYGCEYNKKPINSLCDEWNVWYESFESFGPISLDKVVKYQLTTDTLINGQQYVKLTSDKDSPYLGAMREGNNRDIYYVPAGSTHEYLLYAFNAQEGDQLNNVWLGGNPEDYPYGWTMTVEAIQKTNPRTFVLSTGFITTEEGVENYPLYTTWIEGVGFPETPHEVAELLSPADVGVYTLLCAYKNGEQIYVSEMGAEYGCEHDQTPEPTDTIPLFSYTGDDPGSSTVDPVDPNQVVVTLKGDELTIREFSNVEVTYTLRHNAPAKMPAHAQTSASDTFRNEITLQITESGEYQLLLTNPSWDYSIYGTFFYAPQGIEQIHSSTQGGETSRLVLMNGHIFILRGEKVYTLQGQEVR